MNDEKIQAFQNKILSFYEENKRSFPWRQTTDPYKIWISEIMLQQTQTTRVIPKYEEWMNSFPTVEDVQEASFSTILDYWDGLGFNNRAKWIYQATEKVVEEYEGVLPEGREELKELPGIGPYTSRAIRIFAHNKDEVTVDTNIRRVFIHELNLSEDIEKDDLYDIGWRVLPEGKSRKWHNALMDYGSMEATSRETGIEPETKQGEFEGSNRWYRSKILKKVRQNPLKIQEIKEEYGEKGKKALQTLEKDEMVERDGETIKIPG